MAKIINIGDVFGTWKVIGMETNDKKYNYNYLVKCKCGNKRVIRKDSLLNYTFANCNKCRDNLHINNKLHLIEKKWNTIINGNMILSEIDMDKKYFWKCEKGHNYTEKVLFLNDSCPVCETIRRNQRIQTISLDLLTMITEYLKVLLTKEIKVEHNISISQEYYYVLLELPEANIMIYLKDTNYFNPVFFEDKLSFFEHKMVLDDIKKQLVYCNKEHIFCDIDLKYEKREMKRITKIIKKCCIED